jgi:tRNA dimethylallyltransferase
MAPVLSDTSLPLLVVIVGPTASGKTALSLAIAEQLSGEIVNCDSVAVYREFNIGTAKPSSEERARAPHYLIDIVNPTEAFTAGDYSRMARQTIAEITARQHTPIVVGGTGLYLRALLDGLFEGPPRSETLRTRLRQSAGSHGPGHLHRMLRRLDPQTAANIHANDEPKLIRAIEVCVSAGRAMSELWQRGRDRLTGYRILKIGLDPDRTALYTRINERCRRMFENGLLEETRALWDKYRESAPPLQSLGYKQALQFLRGELDAHLMIAAAQQGHRNYAKRQLTWFRREPDVHWFRAFGDDPLMQAEVIALVRSAP